MKFLIVALACTLGLVALSEAAVSRIFDFNNDPYSLEQWQENSDVQYKNGAGESKAELIFLQKQSIRVAVFFGLANAVTYDGVANMRAQGSWDLSGYTNFLISCRTDLAQGQFNIVLRHKGINKGPSNVYKAKLEAIDEFGLISIPFKSFAPQQADDEPLDTSAITSIAISLDAEEGDIDVGVLEINWIGVN